MFASLLDALLMLVLLAGALAVAEPCPPPGQGESRCIELLADGTGEAPEVQLSPGVSTTLIFDSDMRAGGMTLEHGERFELADLGTRTLTLVPSENVLGERPGKMTVCFTDGAAPTCATFVLVAHPAIADRQVRIFRQPRAVDSYRAELKKAREEIQRLRAENGRLRAENDRPAGLIGLFDSGMVGAAGIPFQRIAESITPRSTNALQVASVTTFRAPGRVLLDLWLELPPGAEPWTMQGAILRGPTGEELKASVWQAKPIPSGDVRRVLIEVVAPDEQTRGPFTLKLWEDGPRTITLGNITFPE